MTIIAFEGFECKEVMQGDDVTGAGTATFDTSITWRSRASFKYVVNNNQAYIKLFRPSSANRPATMVAENDLYWSAHLYIGALPGGGQVCYLYGEFGNTALRNTLRLNENGEILMYDESTLRDTSAALSAGQWYTLEFTKIQSPESATLVISNSDGSVLDTCSAGAWWGNFDVDAVYFGACANSYGTIYLDNIVWSEDELPTTTMGVKDYAIDLAYADADGVNDGGWSGGYADVDETPPDDATTKRQLDDKNHGKVTQGVAWSPIASVASIVACQSAVKWATQGVSGSSNGLVWISGETESNGDTFNATSGDWVWHTRMLTADPDTSAAWTSDAVAAMELGHQRTSTPASNQDIYVTFVGAQVLFVPTTASVAALKLRLIPYGHTMGAYMRPHQRIAGV